MNEVSVSEWYRIRELDRVPRHFIKAPTPATAESLFWVKTKLKGRFSTLPAYDDTIIFIQAINIFFEDPADTMMYELRWSGSK